MTLKELYQNIGGDYDAATKVLLIEKLMDKHIRKLPQSTLFEELSKAAADMDAAGIFESAHAIKGVCSNLGLISLAEASHEICEEFRPGKERTLTDEDVIQKTNALNDMYNKVCRGIAEYEQSNN